MDITRHQFLAALHRVLKPRVYLEIGVQYGSSLVLADAAEIAYGIDPEPLIFGAPGNQLPNQEIHRVTSDEFFQWASWSGAEPLRPIDLAFIDGSHLVEDAMCDYVNVQKHMRPGGVIVFDDVLPYNAAIASRTMPPGGDWTGDVWKCFYILEHMYASAPISSRPQLVNTWPTGTMVLLNIEPTLSMPATYGNKDDMRKWFNEDEPPPKPILDRTLAVHPDYILEQLGV